MGLLSFSEYRINTTNLLYNVKTIKSKLNSGVKLCAVVKADAYGVGAEKVSQIIENEVDMFAVACLEEGIKLRKSKIVKPIMVLGAVNFDALYEYYLYNLSLVVNSVFEMSKLSRETKKPITLQFGLNTGMNRYGFSAKPEIYTAIALLNSNFNLTLGGVYSHLATKENDVDFMYKQKQKFDELIDPFDCCNFITRHLSNTNATMNHNDFNYDMVRCGYALYGMDAVLYPDLKPVVEIKSKIVHIFNAKAGESVGYDRTCLLKRNSIIAVVPLGYYDGINRRISNKGKVIICGRYANIVGRVCMDAFMIDVTDVKNASINSEVTIIGEECGKKITLLDYAKWAGTSSYECLTRFNKSRMKTSIVY